jgi:hypothetical protein
VGNDLRMRYSAVGDTVNLCSRIADHATRHEIYISDSTYKILSSQLDTESAESVRLKGKEEPVTVHKLLSINDEAVDDSVVVTKGFVGRREEKEIISQALSNVLDKREERILVCGEPGVGKSRLKDELVENAVGKGFSVFEGNCSSFETKTPYFLWNTLLKDMLNISVEASENETRKQLHDTLSLLNMNKEEPYLATLLSLRYEEILLEDDQERRRCIFEAMHKLIEKFSQREPTVFILEDIHWADRFSKELLEFLMKKDKLAPALFYIIFRPEYTEYKNIMNQGQLINLDRLSEEDVLELIKMRLDAKEVPDELLQLIKQRTEGNPFFIEESLKTLVENEFISIKRQKITLNKENLESGVPDTVQGVVMARIDRLEGRIRDVLLNASVIGREFSKKLIERVIDGKEDVISHLSHLKGLELILEREEVQEFEYLFKHYMIQEVAYNTILINKRKKLHGLIANAIEEIYYNRLKELYELLAFHYEKAEEWEKAAEYYGRAGRKVREIYTEEESKDLFERKEYAMEKIYESAPERHVRIEIGFRVVFGLLIIGIIHEIIFDIIHSDWLGMMVGVILPFGCLLIMIVVIIPILQRIKLFELMGDRIEIVKKNNERFLIPFTDIEEILGSIPKNKKGWAWKIFYRHIDRNSAMKDCEEVSLKELIKKFGMPLTYPVGLDVKGGVTIKLNSGYNYLKLLLPWLNTIEKSKFICFSPSDPEEFFDQLAVAFEKWKRTNVKGNQ